MSVTETYEYDYQGNRTSKKAGDITFDYTVDLSSGYSQVLKATNGADTVYYTRGFELISRHEGDAASFYLYDGGLSVRALTDTTGAITDTLVFDAFGNETEKTGTTANTYGFQGEEHDVTGLYYLRARYMDPVSGTFTSMDTYAGSLSDPMSLHKYLFANSNPVMYSDPSGQFSKDSTATAITISNILGIAANSNTAVVASFLKSTILKIALTIIASIIISAIILRFKMGCTTTADDIGDIIINDSIPQDVVDALRKKVTEALDKEKTIADTQGLRKAKSKGAWHHIVAKRSLKFSDAHLSRVILSKSKYYDPHALDKAKVDDPDNLVYISTTLHWHLHTTEYHAYVLACLKAVFDPQKDGNANHWPVHTVLRTIAAQLTAMSKLFPDVVVG